MTKCKKKKCPNQVEEGKKHCKYHQSRMEENTKNLLALGSALVLGGIGLFKKNKN